MLLILAIFLVAIAQLLFGFDWNWRLFIINSFNLIKQEYTAEAIALFVGLELGAMSHVLSDLLGSMYKRRQKKKKS